MTLPLAPLPTLQLLAHHIPAHNLTPNTSLHHKPLLIYRAAFPPTTNPTATNIENHLLATGVVRPQWRYTMYSTSHFHSTTHEVLAISRGCARLCFGHEDNPARVLEVVRTGDVVVVPAGVGHRLWEDLSEGEGEGGFEMVGCYPVDAREGWDMCYGRPGEERAWDRIKGLKWFERDPVYGDRGPVLDV